MNSEYWLEKAERLRAELARINSGLFEVGADSTRTRDAAERVTIALWLRSEFSDEPPEDTATLALFPDYRSEPA